MESAARANHCFSLVIEYSEAARVQRHALVRVACQPARAEDAQQVLREDGDGLERLLEVAAAHPYYLSLFEGDNAGRAPGAVEHAQLSDRVAGAHQVDDDI